MGRLEWEWEGVYIAWQGRDGNGVWCRGRLGMGTMAYDGCNQSRSLYLGFLLNGVCTVSTSATRLPDDSN